jgi:tripartite-type tricarboxylate transporter receptor subunit TctC
MSGRRQILAGGAAVLAAPRLAQAQAAWPNERPIEVVIPFPAGGGVDVMARIVMPLVAAQIPGMRHVVTNRIGAAGQIGLEVIFNAAPDGYTLGATTLPAHNAIPMERPARFKAMDFTFLANIVGDANCFYVRADSPFRNVADLVAAARARPGQLTYGTTGVGSDDHLFMLNFEQTANVPPMVHIPFPGAAPLIPQLLGGHMDFAAINVGDALAMKREGRLRILAQAAETALGRGGRRADLPRGGHRRAERRRARDDRPARPAGGDHGAADGGLTRWRCATRISCARRSGSSCRCTSWSARTTGRWRSGRRSSCRCCGSGGRGGSARPPPAFSVDSRITQELWI